MKLIFWILVLWASALLLMAAAAPAEAATQKCATFYIWDGYQFLVKKVCFPPLELESEAAGFGDGGLQAKPDGWSWNG